MSNKIYPIGIQNFEKIRNDGYFYIDKTALIYQMVKTGGYYFLSRPRRFGKSLLLSTLESYFSGKKELFEGLAMGKLEKDWIKYPVIHLDLNAKKFDTVDDLIRLVDRQLLVYEAQYGSCSKDETIDDRFVTLIRMAAESAHAEGKWIGICGELGADVTLTETFLNMGIDELSVAPGMVLKVRQKIREAE